MASLLPFLLLLAVSRCSGWSAGLAHMPPTHVRLHAASPPLVMCDTQLPDAQSRADCRAMRVAEIKAELEVRGVSCEGVVEKDELADLLARARVQGKASPDILDSFNKENLERDQGLAELLQKDPEAVELLSKAKGITDVLGGGGR